MPEQHKKNIVEISFGTIIKTAILVIAIAVLYYIRDIVAMILFAIVVASAVEPGAEWFEKRKIPRVFAVIFIYVAAFVVLGATFYLIVPNFISEISNFISSLPAFFQNPTFLQKIISLAPSSSDGSLASLFQEIFVQFQSQISKVASGFFKTTASVFGGAMSFVLLIVLSFYLSVQKDGLEDFLKIVTPIKYEDYILGLWQRSRTKIGLWMQGQILLGILVGVLVFLGLTILDVEYSLSFALFAAVFEIIPIFGPVLASIPPIAVAFLESPTLALEVAILFIIVQQFENHLIYPLVVKKIVGVPPTLVILALLVGGKLGGFLGILLAVPLATVLKEFFNDVAAKKHPIATK
ncbi:MAG: AI-2E family transporter [Candidatus Pacebacteria bacterium]|nr:AI-2E family transporter [Candidatus Paceibacterota bacterium]